MDPVSILTIVEMSATATSKVISYLKDVKIASKQRAQMRAEAHSLVILLTDLKEDMEADEQADDSSLRGCLETLSGPLRQFQSDMEDFAKQIRLEPSRLQSLRWSFDKKGVLAVLNRIERTKTLVLLAIERDQTGLLRELQRAIDNIEEGVNSIKLNQANEKLEKALHWLSPVNHTARKNDLAANLEEGTREWFIKGIEFQEWLQSQNQTLLCVGAAAVGKSHLFSAVVKYLEMTIKNSHTPVLFAYCSYQDKDSQSADTIMASLLRQLAASSSEVSETIINMYDAYLKNHSRPSPIKILDTVVASLHKFENAYVLVDALDEIIESGGLRGTVMEQLQTLPKCSNLFITTRPIISITNAWASAVNVDIQARDEDLQKCIDWRLENDRSLSRHVGKDREFRNLVTSTIIEKCRGLFLLAPLYLNSLASKINKRQMRDALQNLPVGLDEMYLETLRRISGQGEEAYVLATRALQFVTFAFRPLTILQLQAAVAIEPDMTSLDEESLSDQETLLSVCGGLLSVDSEDQHVRLVHYTTKDFLERYQNPLWDTAHEFIAKTCIICLSFESSDYLQNEDEEEQGEIEAGEEMIWNIYKRQEQEDEESAFWQYAADYWGDHAKVQEAALSYEIHDFFTKDRQAWKAAHYGFLRATIRNGSDVLELMKTATSHLSCGTLASNALGLYFAAHFGMLEILKALLDAGAKTEISNTRLPTPLKISMDAGTTDCMLMLLRSGVDIDHTAALHYGARCLRSEEFEMLLEFQPNLNARDERNRTVLHHALQVGDQEIVKSLIRHGADIMARDNVGSTPLHYAAESRVMAAVTVLLDSGADIEALDDRVQTPLMVAVHKRDEYLANLFLLRGASPRCTGAKLQSEATTEPEQLVIPPDLLTRISELPVDTVSYLFSNHKVDPQIRDCDGGTLLHAAGRVLVAHEGSSRTSFVRLLVQNGCDVDAINDRGETATYVACKCTNEALVKSVLEQKADPNIKSNQGVAPLQCVVKEFPYSIQDRGLRVVRMLVRHGADVLVDAQNAKIPLEIAIRRNHSEIARALLETRRDEQMRQIDWNQLRSEGFKFGKTMTNLLDLEQP